MHPRYLLWMSNPPACTVYFDGSCPICSAEIAWYKRRSGEAVAFVDVSGDGAPAPDLTREAAMARFHVRDENGDLLSGAPAFIALWHRVPGIRWAGRLAAIPPIPWILELGYRLFLAYRRKRT